MVLIFYAKAYAENIFLQSNILQLSNVLYQFCDINFDRMGAYKNKNLKLSINL